MPVTGLLKPCYVFAPRTLVRRVGMSLRPPSCAQLVTLPWGAILEVNANEGIGRELVRQNVFDIAVSETAWRLLRRGDLAVDVGANIGYMTSLFAARVGREGRVEAFEPHPRIFRQLQHNVSRFGFPVPSRLRLNECAVGSRDGIAQLLEPESFGLNEGAATLHPSRDGESPRAFQVRVAKLDSLAGNADIALLKVDVEGLEGEVFAGAAGLLRAGAITHIIYEAHDCERSPLHALLADYGYAIYGIGHGLLGPRITAGRAAPRVDRRWESPSYLATLSPETAAPLLQARGWQVLRGC